MFLSFYLFFCTDLFFFVLISSLRLIFCPSSTSSSFHSNFSFFLSRSWLDHLPPQVSSSSFSSHCQTTYPPQAPISTIRTTRIKTHKHRSPQPAPIHKYQNLFLSTHKHWSSLPTLIHKHPDPFPSTHELWSSTTSTNPQATNINTDLSLCWFVRVGVFVIGCGYVCVSLCWFVYVDVFVCIWGKRRWGKEKFETEFVLHGEERKKVRNVKLIK